LDNFIVFDGLLCRNFRFLLRDTTAEQKDQKDEYYRDGIFTVHANPSFIH